METTTCPFYVKNLRIFQQNVLSVVVITQQTTGDAESIRNSNLFYNKQKNPIPIPQSTFVNPSIVNATSNSSSDPHKTYARTTTENAKNYSKFTSSTTPEISLKLSSFLEELKNLICLLISLLTTVILQFLKMINNKSSFIQYPSFFGTLENFSPHLDINDIDHTSFIE